MRLLRHCLFLSLAAFSLAGDPARGTGVPPTMDADTVWTKGGSPYVIAADASVAASAVLTVEPGVRVELAEGVSLFVAGCLVARGTWAEPIVFTGQKDGDAVARWGSVVFEDGSQDAKLAGLRDYVSGSVVEHCRFEGGTRGVVTHAASPLIHACVFEGNETEFGVEPAGGAGILVGKDSSPLILGCTFRKNVANLLSHGGAIYIDRANPIVQGNEFVENMGSYGGAIATSVTAAPIVGNTFRKNVSNSEGGAVSLLSSSSAFLNNVVEQNEAQGDDPIEGDGGGVHVCRGCYPHANPFLMDNRIVGNTCQKDAAGVGAAFVRMVVDNEIHGNTRKGGPADFGWYHLVSLGFPSWVQTADISRNYWGTTDPQSIEATVFDGSDDQQYGKAPWDPPLSAAPGPAKPRVVVTTRKIFYGVEGEVMPVHLTLYNPGSARDVELTVLLQYGDGPKVPFQGALDFPSAKADGTGFALHLPADSTYFTTLLTGTYSTWTSAHHGTWHAVMTDAGSGEVIGEVCSTRFELGKGPVEEEEEVE